MVTALCELVLGHIQVEWGRALPDPAGGVVVRAVTRAVVAAPFSGVGDGHTAQMCADSHDDQVFRVIDPFVVGLGIAEL